MPFSTSDEEPTILSLFAWLSYNSLWCRRQHVAAWALADAKDQPSQHAHALAQALLHNLHAYYRQFMPAADKALADGLAPAEKSLKVGSLLEHSPCAKGAGFASCSAHGWVCMQS